MAAVSQYSDVICVICRNEVSVKDERLIKLRSDGKQTLKRFSCVHGHNSLTEYLSGDPLVVCVHKSCQLKYTCERDVGQSERPQSALDDIPIKKLRSVQDIFEWKNLCFLCCNPVTERFREVRTMNIHQNMLQTCKNRNDEWGMEVLGRLQTCGYLHAA